MGDTKGTVLITGANGFVGSRLVKKFIDEGYHVVAGVRASSDLSLLEGQDVEYRYGDINDPDSLPPMVAGVDFVVHNAGVVKARREETFYRVNEVGTRNLMAAIAEHNEGVRRVVYISSLAGAGPSLDNRPVTESDPPHPLTVYGKSKIAGETAALEFAGRLNVVILRPSGVYGPGDKEIFSFFQAVHRHLRPAIGNQGRKLQIVHVDDLTEAVFRAVVAEVETGSVYFVAESRAYTMRELTGLLVEAIGRWTVPVCLPGWAFRGVAAVSEVLFKLVGATPMLTREKARELLASWEVDVSKARRELGFESRIGFAEGARQTYQWYREQGWL